jgi:endoglycosylceramidase
MRKTVTTGILLIVALSGFSGASQQGTGKISINPGSRLMVDQYGRSVIMHGVNIVPKTYPYIPKNDTFDPVFSLTDDEIEGLSNWGFNVVRLGMMWQAVETTQGVYNDTYLDEMEALINKMGAKGIYSLVDGHQDAVSNDTCGEGFPNFYTKTAKDYCDGGFIPWMMDYYGLCYSIRDFGYRFTPTGEPYVEDCRTKSFAEYYMTAESLDVMEQLYTPTPLQDKYVAYWAKVAKRLAGNPYVVGYDPLNEPFPSNVFKNPEIVFEPGLFDSRSLEPLYARTYQEAYKSADPKSIMFFEAAEFPDEMGIFGGLVFNLGFTKPPGGEMNSPYHVVNDHTYCFQLVSGENKLGAKTHVSRNNT